MDTKPLERFATWARRELINAVDARATAVLAVGSVARSERAEVIKKLEAEIARHGRQQVVDKVAYIWFNRIIALRFMDARGYTDAAVVSPAQGQTHGQPEILADAKRGNLDADVVTNSRTANAIIGLLDGTRRSTDAEGEAYAMLLTEYCRYWHKPMPFMFEREGDYTELLVPANLLADGAILARACEVLTEEVCDYVEVIGWLYQFYISERKAEVFAGFKRNKKAGADEIPAATQLFTPHWIVRYLVENSLGRLWMLNRPNSRLVDRMNYFIAPVDEETEFLKISKPEELTVIDPACGSGHMLTYAFDLLYAIYEEEGYAPSDIPSLILTHNLHGTEIDPRAGALAAFALAMKARANQRAFFNKEVEPNVCVIEPISFGTEELAFLAMTEGNKQEDVDFWNQFAEAETFGSLIRPDFDLSSRLSLHLETLRDLDDMLNADTIERARRAVRQAKYLLPRYAVVVANPPYMGSGSMAAKLLDFGKTRYPESKSDLFAMFIDRSLALVFNGGLVAMVTMQSWMFLSGFERLRRALLRSNRLVAMAHLGTGAFDTLAGEVVSTTAFVLNKGDRGSGEFVRLANVGSSKAKNGALVDPIKRAEVSFKRDSEYFENLPGASIIYWFSDDLGSMFSKYPATTSSFSPMNGMTTGSNGLFVRYWYEVGQARSCFDAVNEQSAASTGARWFPYNKGGGGARRWYGNVEFVIDWENSGKRISDYGHAFLRGRRNYFRPMITWSKINTGRPGFRYIPAGFLFDVAGMGLFANDSVSQVTFMRLLGYLNSSVAAHLLAGLSPTLNVESGQVGSLPLPSLNSIDEHVVAELVALQEDEWNSHEISWAFQRPSLFAVATREALKVRLDRVLQDRHASRERLHKLESRNEAIVSESLGFQVDGQAQATRGTIDEASLAPGGAIADLVSYAVGCMFGRYSLDTPGLILADPGATMQDFVAKVPNPTFMPDADNVIPFVDEDRFQDDIVGRFRQFLRAAFGDENFEENLRFVEESLGVQTLRDYFVSKAGRSKFYDDHVQRYKKRPIYWMFSSPKGSFNALIYMHRYTPSTASTVLNEYLRDYRAKLEIALANAERVAVAGGSPKEQKEADRLRKVLVELGEYEHDVLYPLATQQIAIDLDDGVKVNYPKFYPALKKITGLEGAA